MKSLFVCMWNSFFFNIVFPKFSNYFHNGTTRRWNYNRIFCKNLHKYQQQWFKFWRFVATFMCTSLALICPQAKTYLPNQCWYTFDAPIRKHMYPLLTLSSTRRGTNYLLSTSSLDSDDYRWVRLWMCGCACVLYKNVLTGKPLLKMLCSFY